MKTLLALGWLVVAIGSGLGDAPSAAWQKVRDKQPAALHLKLTLSKDHYFQGEEIDATVDFSNDDATQSVSLCVGVGAAGAVFHAADEKGIEASNPRQWEEDWLPRNVTGPVGFHDLGQYSLKLPVNDSLGFDHPGVYRLYAQSSVTDGPAMTSQSRSEIVSDPVIVTIVPLDASTEKTTIEAAMDSIHHPGENDGGVRLGVAKLGYLQTRAARDQLIALLADEKGRWFAQEALLGSPDPAEDARRILEAASQGKLVLDDNGGMLYGELSAADMLRDTSPRALPEAERARRYEAFSTARDAAREKLMQVQLEGTAGHGAAHVDALWAAFRNEAVHRNPVDPDSDGGKARAALAAHQLELPEHDIKELLEDWPYWGLDGFLPLVRREANVPHPSMAALIAWADLDPVAARPAIIRELKEQDSRFFIGSYSASMLLPAIKPMPLPQFDSLFRSRFPKGTAGAFPIIPVIGAFGSAALLPDVVKAFQVYGKSPQGNWDDAILTCLFRYWLRCDPVGGAVALEKEIDSRTQDGWGFFDTVFRNSWSNEALPVMKWALAGRPELATEAVFLLEKHGDESWIDPILATIKKVGADKKYADYVSSESGRMLKSTRWHYTDAQRKQLEAWAATGTSK